MVIAPSWPNWSNPPIQVTAQTFLATRHLLG
jgi:hypothetical protein